MISLAPNIRLTESSSKMLQKKLLTNEKYHPAVLFIYLYYIYIIFSNRKRERKKK